MRSSVREPSFVGSAEVVTAPLSALQQGMLFDSLRFEGCGRNIEVLVLGLRGPLDPRRLETAWERVTDRHDALRASFRLTADGPVQDILPAATVPFSVEDVALTGAAERDWFVNGCVQSERRRGFLPGDASWQRVRLIRFDPGAHALIWTSHHAIMDGRARRIVLRDVADAYAGIAPLRPAPSYREHLTWLAEQPVAASENYWRERLRDFAAPTPLPAAFGPGADHPQHAGSNAVAERTLAGVDTARLLAFAQRERLTPGVLVQSAWALLLARHAGTADVVFGTVRAGRTATPAGNDGAGLMIATLPLRVNVADDAPLTAWLRDVRARWDELREHEHVPQRTIANWSELPPAQPLFETLVVYERETLLEAITGNVDAEGVLGVHSAQLFEDTGFPLTLIAAGTTELQLRLAYDTSRFGADDAGRLIDELCTLLRAFPRHGGGCVGDVPLLTERESADLVTQWNRTTRFPEHATAHALFQEQARQTPDAVALQLGAATLSYGELERRSRSVAAYLQSAGIGRGDFVAVHVERSFEMVAALLGVLTAGAASIALDLHLPPDRVAAIVREGAVRVVLTQAALGDELRPVLARVTAPPAIINVASIWETPSAAFAEPPASALDPAHVMYTSGSTGVPKGAVLPHQAIVRTVRETDYVRFAADETFFAFVPLTFDVAILEIWGPLLNGGRLVLCPPGLPSLDVLAQTIETHGVTTLWLTTALFEQIVDEELAHLRGLRQLIVGGDVMSPAHARRLMHAFPALRLLNVYGPTEATVLITAHHLTAPPQAPIPLGKPIPNAMVYVLDARLRPVPVGVPGEIFTGGAGVALGYLNQPERTAERFVPDPFSSSAGATMYRSGDLARWRADGTIDFLGRVDTQIKIRGVRIELGAIESALTDHPQVQEAVVVATAGGASGKQLAAYVVARSAEPPTARDIKTFLATRFAAASVPDIVAFVPAIPRTATGKFDRRALPDPAAFAGDGDAPERRPPTTPLEIALAGEVAAVLELEDIGLDDNFYAFGGDSLRAMRLIARLRHAFGTPVTVRDLIAAPTVGELSALLATLRRDPAVARPERMRAERATGRRTPVFFLHGDLIGGGRYCADLARRLDPERPFFAVAPHGVEGDRFPASIEAMARENCALIRERYPAGPVILGGYCNGGVVAFEMARQLERAGVTVAGLTIVDGFIFNTERSSVSDIMRRQARRHLERLGLGRALVAPDADEASWEAAHERLVESWYDALARYVPRRYTGRATLLWTEEIAPRSEALTSAWQRVAPHAQRAGIIPGSHLTAITRHLERTGEILAAALEAGSAHATVVG
jgi:amino acid adenylation domain-containing protein